MAIHAVTQTETSLLLRAWHSKVALQSACGQHLRYLPAALAREMVAEGKAEVSGMNGKIRAVVLTTPASAYASRTGRPEGGCLFGTKFTRWTNQEESGTRVIEHHPRAMDYE